MSEQVEKHTPGPWEWDGKFTVCITADDGTTCFRTRREDARLIAAAPELLAALKDVIAQFDAGYFVRNTDSDGASDWALKAAGSVRSLATAVDAIAKAEGKEGWV